MQDKNYCPTCGAFLVSDPHKPICGYAQNEYAKGFLDALYLAARKAMEWADECAGGSGSYGQGYRNLAQSITKITVPKVGG